MAPNPPLPPATAAEPPTHCDPVCLVHGKRKSEHDCLYCCLCFVPLTIAECHVDENGEREDVCHACAAAEQRALQGQAPRPSYVSHPTHLRYRLERIANVEAKLAEIRREWEARGKGGIK